MFVINKFLASLFSLVIYAVLRISGWKRKAVFANLLHVSLASVQPVDLPRLYRRLLDNGASEDFLKRLFPTVVPEDS